ncbi:MULTISPECIES: A24 family peptidase [Actinomycetes]|uniref:prepilin peptidase n=1 Tax=Actinomycetes TaxID=1760 RepID=UPI0001DEE42D|nr:MULTISPECIES: A24 family peptidase [Actinomycetes]EFL06564.1 predicted protein [Streptomyces sp. AA4]
MVLTAVLAAGAVVPVLLVMTKKAGAPVSAVLGMATALAAVAVAASRADAGAFPAWWLPVAWLVSVLGVPLALADVRHRRLPDVLTLPAYPVVALTLTLAAASGGGWRLAAGAVLGCLLFGGTHLIVHRLSAGGLGPGDVKLAGSFGAVLGAVGGLAPAVAAVLAAMVSLTAVVPMWLMRRIRQMRELRASARSSVGRLPRSEAEGGLHEPTPNQPDSRPLALAQPSTPTDAAHSAAGPTDAAQLLVAEDLAGVAGSAVPTDIAGGLVPGPAADPAKPFAPANPAELTASAQPTGPAVTPSPPSLARTPELPSPAQSSTPTDFAHPPSPNDDAATPSPPEPARPRIRAGPLRVPYGPGLVLATWACAVFPAAGTGIA